ncbi:MAG: M20 family metallopeptidase, partial [Gemmatimonadota bacterium]
LASRAKPDLVLVGEPSRNEVRRGHRGRVELHLRVKGRMAHASVPELGANPLLTLGAFLAALPALSQPDDPELRRATISPTLLRTDQTSANVIPGEVCLTLDCRTVPGQDAERVRELLLPLLRRSESPGTTGDIEIPSYARQSWTGYEMTYPADNPAHALPSDHAAIRSAVAVLAEALGAAPPIDVWRFATDGGHFAEQGLTVVGFGPGDDRLAHTIEERIPIRELERGVRGNAALARRWPVAYSALS